MPNIFLILIGIAMIIGFIYLIILLVKSQPGSKIKIVILPELNIVLQKDENICSYIAFLYKKYDASMGSSIDRYSLINENDRRRLWDAVHRMEKKIEIEKFSGYFRAVKESRRLLELTGENTDYLGKTGYGIVYVKGKRSGTESISGCRLDDDEIERRHKIYLDGVKKIWSSKTDPSIDAYIQSDEFNELCDRLSEIDSDSLEYDKFDKDVYIEFVKAFGIDCPPLPGEAPAEFVTENKTVYQRIFKQDTIEVANFRGKKQVLPKIRLCGYAPYKRYNLLKAFYLNLVSLIPSQKLPTIKKK